MMNNTTSELDQWFSKLEALPLECDGMSRVISHLLSEDNIEHEISVGSLECHNGKIPLHYWITLQNGSILDLRARMWLGNKDGIPHGLISPGEFNYIKKGSISTMKDDFLFMILSERKPTDFKPVPCLEVAVKIETKPTTLMPALAKRNSARP
ncbi:hypothetical protein ACK32R_04610 [Aeromonas dhakensis]|jgi:hypothetical protein|uniref:hypothetical protein n=1 Tax=Aeromonas dhakensis TaxID=196024 RepID=UPI00398857A7